MTAEKIFTRDFVLVFLSQFAFSCGFSVLMPSLPIYLARSGSNEQEIGILIGALSIASLGLRPPVGKALQRIPERTFMISGAFLSALTPLAYLLVSPFWPFLIARVLQGVGFAFYSTACSTLIVNISPEARRGQSLGYFFLSFNIPLALAPAFGMFLINHYGFTYLFLNSTALYFCSLVLIVPLSKKKIDAPKEPSSHSETLINLKTLLPYSQSFFVGIFWGTVTTFFPLFALGHGVTNPGIFFTTLAVMLILGRTLGGRILDVYRRESVILPCLVVYIVSMAILAFSTTLPLFILVAIIWGAGHSLVYPALFAYAVDRAGPSRGLVLGVFTAVGDLGSGLGPAVMGIVLRFTSYPVMFLCLAFIGVLNISCFYFVARRGKASGEQTHSQ